MTTHADLSVLANSLSINDTLITTPMDSKSVVWIPDQNNGSYNGELVWDLNQLGSSNKWLDLSNAFIQVPYIVSMKSNANINAAVNEFSLGLKNGYFSIIDSINVEMAQKTVMTNQRFTNVKTNFELLTSLDKATLEKIGPSIGFWPDTPAYTFLSDGTVGDVNGSGFRNNKETSSAGYLSTIKYNEGFIKRRDKTTAYKPDSVVRTDVQTIAENMARSYFTTSDVAVPNPDANTVYNWVIIATIYLRDICDVFKSIPLSKCSDIRIVIKYNSVDFTLTETSDGTHISITSYNQLSGNTNPVLIGDGLGSFNGIIIADGPGGAGNKSKTIQIRTNVMKNNLSTSFSYKTMTSTRLYVPAYDIMPQYAAEYISKHPKVKFGFNSFYQYNFNVDAGNPFNMNVITGIQNVQNILIIAYPNGTVPTTDSSNIYGAATQKLEVWQSPWDTAPNTSPCAIRDLQIQLGGKNIWNSNEQYDFESFLNELADYNKGSGLINMSDFEKGYRFYFANLSRHMGSDNKFGKSIIITGTNPYDNLKLSLLVFVSYRKELSFETATGMIVE